MVKYYNKRKGVFKQFFTVKPSSKKLNVTKRYFAATARDEIEQSEVLDDICFIDSEIKKIHALSAPFFGETVNIFDNRLKLLREWKFQALIRLDEIMFVAPDINEPVKRTESKHIRIGSFSDSEVNTNLNFKSNEQLRELYEAFSFPETFETPGGYKFNGEEVLILGLYRMATTGTSTDIAYTKVFGLDHDVVSRMFKAFVYHMAAFGYLVEDNIEYWKPYLADFAEKIRLKCAEEGCHFPSSNDPNGGFNIFGFIDNTMTATCRPAGGPARSGVALGPRLTLENKVLSSCREVIEWDYGQLFGQWKRLDYAKGLRLRVMPVGKIMIVAIILRNAYTCLNGNQTSLYFKCKPPTLYN